METYYNLRDIMRFLLHQQKKGYQDVNTLIEILKSDKLDVIRKKFTLIAGLRECGLMSKEHVDSETGGETLVGNFELIETVEFKAYEQGKGQPVSCDLVAHKMDNGVLRFLIILN